jgi:UDP-N-acetylmuramoylalanine--D-glutamate ligase
MKNGFSSTILYPLSSSTSQFSIPIMLSTDFCLRSMRWTIIALSVSDWCRTDSVISASVGCRKKNIGNFQIFFILVNMILIYGKWKVGKGIAHLCDFLKIPYELRDDADKVNFSSYEWIIPSPGIPSHHDVYKTWKVKSELDFVFEYLPKGFKIIAVTGTDGKSTTSWILYELMRQEFGDDVVYLWGNFDIPFAEIVCTILQKKQKRWYIVLEVSSFMAYSLKLFQADYSIFTNFKPDHLNWHSDLNDYFHSKMNLIMRTKKRAIIHEKIFDFANEYHLISPQWENIRLFRFWYPDSKSKKDWTDGENIIVSWRKKYLLSETHFSGKHNAENILSAVLVLNEMGVCSKHTKRHLKNILWLPHRLEKIGEKNGILFVEDSKSTSAQSLEAALSSYGWESEKNLLLIVWGSDKGDSFEYLSVKLQSRVRALVCIGATKQFFINIAKDKSIPYLSTDNLNEGVEWLYKEWKSGDVLMLSPGCASFWLFRDYLDRATQFRNAIKKLP